MLLRNSLSRHLLDRRLQRILAHVFSRFLMQHGFMLALTIAPLLGMLMLVMIFPLLNRRSLPLSGDKVQLGGS
ncbi:MAG: hypothetical protein A2X31_12355 [Elusimicrobia bacterium GWB2_63_22]|nr:MAG: hypothetical protein A2X31_12355 [Elusimicrobia bacterium GWB2_63_22]